MTLSQKQYGDLREAYLNVYASKFETILDEFADQEVEELSDEIIEEIVEKVFEEYLEEGWDINSIEQTLCESLDKSLDLLNEDRYSSDVDASKAKEKIEKVKSAVKKVGSESSDSDDSEEPSRPSEEEEPTKKGNTRKAVGGAVRSVGKLLKRGLKKAIGGTARSVSKGADEVANEVDEEIELIELEVADDMSDMKEVLETSGKFSGTEIENILKVSDSYDKPN